MSQQATSAVGSVKSDRVPTSEASEYFGQSAIAVACTQLGGEYTDCRVKRVVDGWVFLPRHTHGNYETRVQDADTQASSGRADEGSSSPRVPPGTATLNRSMPMGTASPC